MDSIIVKPVGQINEEHYQEILKQSLRDQELIDRIKQEVGQEVGENLSLGTF